MKITIEIPAIVMDAVFCHLGLLEEDEMNAYQIWDCSGGIDCEVLHKSKQDAEECALSHIEKFSDTWWCDCHERHDTQAEAEACCQVADGSKEKEAE